MRLLVEMTSEEFDRLMADEFHVVSEPVGLVEVRQTDGLLNQRFECAFVESLGFPRAASEGMPDGFPAIRVWLRPEKE